MKVTGLYHSKHRNRLLQNWTTTFSITFTLAGINYGDSSNFFFFWMRSWLVAGLISNVFSFFIFKDKK